MPQLEIDSSNPVQNLNKLILGVIEIIKENILIGNSVNKSVTNATTPEQMLDYPRNGLITIPFPPASSFISAIIVLRGI